MLLEECCWSANSEHYGCGAFDLQNINGPGPYDPEVLWFRTLWSWIVNLIKTFRGHVNLASTKLILVYSLYQGGRKWGRV